jgi:hypothetical protein
MARGGLDQARRIEAADRDQLDLRQAAPGLEWNWLK